MGHISETSTAYILPRPSTPNCSEKPGAKVQSTAGSAETDAIRISTSTVVAMAMLSIQARRERTLRKRIPSVSMPAAAGSRMAVSRNSALMPRYLRRW